MTGIICPCHRAVPRMLSDKLIVHFIGDPLPRDTRDRHKNGADDGRVIPAQRIEVARSHDARWRILPMADQQFSAFAPYSRKAEIDYERTLAMYKAVQRLQ
jgi:hypothetical protein